MRELKLSIPYRVLIFLFLVILAIYLTLYTVSAYTVAEYAGRGYWTCRGSLGDPTFFPFPSGPRGVGMDVIGEMSLVDEFIYLYLIETGILIVLCASLWILAAVFFFRAILPLFKAWKVSFVGEGLH